MIDLDYDHDWYDLSVHYHESIGILLFIFIFFRVLWRWFNIAPALSSMLSAFEKKSAKVAHQLLYFLSLLILVSGYLIPTADNRGVDVFAWFTVPSLGSIHHLQADYAGIVHEWGAWGLIVLASVHALAACKHHFIDKDNTLKNIL